MPEGTLTALADHGEIGDSVAPGWRDGEALLARFARAGVDVDALSTRAPD